MNTSNPANERTVPSDTLRQRKLPIANLPLMRALTLAFLGVVSTVLADPQEPVALKGGTAPTNRHEVVLEADKDTPSFGHYELKGDDSQFPAILIRELPSGRIVGRLSWPGDPSGGDTQPLRSHTEVLWSPSGEGVVINTDERFYAYCSVFAREPGSGRFVQVRFPDYKTLTGFSPPDSNQLRPRGFARGLSWTPEGHLVYVISYSPGASYEGPDPLSHRITLRVTSKGMEVIKREANPEGA